MTRSRADLELQLRSVKADRDRADDALLTATMRRFLRLYGWLNLAADPQAGRSFEGPSRSHPVFPPIPGGNTVRFRAALRSVNRRLDSLASQIEGTLSGERSAGGPRGRMCPGCGRRGRTGACFCDGCGTVLEAPHRIVEV